MGEAKRRGPGKHRRLKQRKYEGNEPPFICKSCRERAGDKGSVFVDRVFLTNRGWDEHRRVIHGEAA